MRGLKDKKIIIYKHEIIKDSAGFSSKIYRPIHAGRLWAYVRQLSASQYYASAALQLKEEMLFTVNWRNDIDPANGYVEYKCLFYDITRVDTYEGYKEDLKLYGALIGTLGKGSILEWGE